jgi:lambda repressor-like predicted transcriptional regulator
MRSPEIEYLSDKTPSVVPVLSTVIPDSQITDALRAALDARELEQITFMALGDELVQSLRPELERLIAELVHRSLRQAWASRFKLDGDCNAQYPPCS